MSDDPEHDASYEKKYGIVHLPNSKCTRGANYILAHTGDLDKVNCRDCLEALTARGESAVARLIELDQEAGDAPVGGACDHPSAYECLECEVHRCTHKECDVVLVKGTRTKIYSVLCDECMKFHDEVTSEEYPRPQVDRLHGGPALGIRITHPLGLSAFSTTGKTTYENHRRAMTLLRAAMGRLGPRALEDFRNPVPTFKMPSNLRADDLATLQQRIAAFHSRYSIPSTLGVLDSHPPRAPIGVWGRALDSLHMDEPDDVVFTAMCGCVEAHEGPCAP